MRRSMIRGNAPPRGSVLRDPEMVEIDRLDRRRREGDRDRRADARATDLSNAGLVAARRVVAGLLGQKTPKQAMDDVASDWQRAIRRAGGFR